MTNMESSRGLSLQRTIPVLASVYNSRTVVSVSRVSKWSCNTKHLRPHRRLVLGFGISFWTQFMSMADTNISGKRFVASARQKGAIEEVNF